MRGRSDGGGGMMERSVELSEEQQELVEFLRECTRERWPGQPFYLSMVQPRLKEAGRGDYRQILGEEKISAFVRRTEGEDTYKVVVHPRQKAKIGLIPPGEDYQFSVEEVADRDVQRGPDVEGAGPRFRGSGSLLLELLRELGRLSPEEQNAVVIPTRVLVKLAHRR